MSTLSAVIKTWKPYDYFAKEDFHKAGKRILKALVKDLGLAKTEYEIRSNKAGCACSGEVTLHSEHWYVQISADRCGLPAVLYRLCNGQKDYTGFSNHYAHAEDLERTASFATRLRRMLEDPRAKGAVMSDKTFRISSEALDRFATQSPAA